MELAGASTRQYYLVQRWERRSALNRRTEIAGLDPLGRCTLWSRGGRALATIPTGASLLGEPTRLHRHVVCTRHAAKKITGKKRTPHSSDARTAAFSTLRCTAEALPLAVDGFGGGASALRPGVRDERGSCIPRVLGCATTPPWWAARQLCCGKGAWQGTNACLFLSFTLSPPHASLMLRCE